MQKGQYIRLLLATTANHSTVIAAAKQMALHGSAQTEDSSTKDTTGNALEFEVTGQTYDITGGGLVLTPNDTLLSNAVGLNNFESWLQDQILYWRICVMNGDNNRSIVEEIAHGQGKLTNLQIQAQVKQNTTYSYTIIGYGSIVPGTDTSGD